jgi:hypothetical protein
MVGFVPYCNSLIFCKIGNNSLFWSTISLPLLQLKVVGGDYDDDDDDDDDCLLDILIKIKSGVCMLIPLL